MGEHDAQLGCVGSCRQASDCAERDLRSDPARISERYGEAKAVRGGAGQVVSDLHPNLDERRCPEIFHDPLTLSLLLDLRREPRA
jgi:hypothetical protein